MGPVTSELVDDLEPDVVALEAILHISFGQPAQLGGEHFLANGQDVSEHRADARALTLVESLVTSVTHYKC